MINEEETSIAFLSRGPSPEFSYYKIPFSRYFFSHDRDAEKLRELYRRDCNLPQSFFE